MQQQTETGPWPDIRAVLCSPACGHLHRVIGHTKSGVARHDKYLGAKQGRHAHLSSAAASLLTSTFPFIFPRRRAMSRNDDPPHVAALAQKQMGNNLVSAVSIGSARMRRWITRC